MKSWMKSLAVPAALAGGMFASNAFADPRDVLQPNHSNHGAVARSSASVDGTASPAERAQVPTERIHMQTQAQQAAMGGEAGSERTGDSTDVQRKSEHAAKADKKHQAIGIHLGAGDNPAERETGANVAKSSSAKMGRANKDGERPHFSAAQSEEMGSSQPARDDGQGESSQKQHAGAQNKEVASKGSGEQLHLAPQQMQEMNPEGANNDKAGASSHSPNFDRTEAKFGREMPEPRAQTIQREQPNFHLPQAFYH